MLCNTAIFYDIENLLGLFSSHNNTSLQLDEVYRRVLETEGVNGVSIQRAYTDWGLQINRNLRNSILQIGIEPVQIFNTNQNDKVKNAADVSLIIDAVDLIQKRPDIENFVIVSGDGIFAFLAKKLHEYGKRVIGVGFNRNANIIFRNACDYYISLEKTDKSLTATSSKSAIKGQSAVAIAAAAAAANGNGNTGQAQKDGAQNAQGLTRNDGAQQPAPAVLQQQPKPAAVPAPTQQQQQATPTQQTAPVQQPAPQSPAEAKAEPSVKQPTRRQGKVPVSFPKTKLTDTLLQAEFPVWYKPEHSANSNGGLLAVRNMLNVLFAGTDENADVEISILMTYVNYYVPGFSVSMYNLKRYRDIVRLITTASPYCVYQDGTILRIYKRAASVTKGTLLEDMPGLVVTLNQGQKLKSIFDVPDNTEFTYTLAQTEKPAPAPKKPPQNKVNKPKAKAAAPAVATLPASEAPAPEAPPAVTVDTLVNESAPPAAETAEPELLLTREAARMPVAPVRPVEEEGDGTPVRKMIKAGFMTLSLDNKLPGPECKKLTTQEYCHKTFGVKAPVFREILTKANLQEQRMINGKIRYWKEVFKFNGKSYLVFKEWSAQVHRDRFVAWLKKFEG